MESVFEMAKYLAGMIFVSSIAAQFWIALIDITGLFSKAIEKFRPAPVQDKYSRIFVVLGVIFVFFKTQNT